MHDSQKSQFEPVFGVETKSSDIRDYIGRRSSNFKSALIKSGIDELSDSNAVHRERLATEANEVDRELVLEAPPPWKERKTLLDVSVALQSWEGVVLELQNDQILVRLFDLKDRNKPELTTTLPTSELDAEDLVLCRPGAMFYWSIGYAQNASGRKRDSMLRFRRLPQWKQSEVDRAKREARALEAMFADEGKADVRAAR